MKYKFTIKGQALFPNYYIEVPVMGPWCITARERTHSYLIKLAFGALEVKALLDMGIIDEDVELKY